MTIDNGERFECLLAALERDLLEATDEEILEAAGDLGMNPVMKGSAAFFGVTVGPRAPFRQSDTSQSSQTHTTRRGLKDQ
jgi:hypothetical protein